MFIRPARRMFEIPELRKMVFERLSDTDLRQTLLVNKNAFQTGADFVFREIDHDQTARLDCFTVSCCERSLTS